jgi:hypothetical protein
MARTVLTVKELPRTHPGGEVVYTWEAADIVDQNEFMLTGREVLLIKSADGAPQDVVIDSVSDRFGRQGPLTVTVAAGAEVALAFLSREGWMQPEGTLHLDCSVVTLSYAVLRLP